VFYSVAALHESTDSIIPIMICRSRLWGSRAALRFARRTVRRTSVRGFLFIRSSFFPRSQFPFLPVDAFRSCMFAVKSEKIRIGYDKRKRNEQMSNVTPKERLQMAQITLTGLQLVLQELVAAQPPHLIPDLSDQEIDFHIKSWLHRCTSAWAQISTIACHLKEIVQKEQKRLMLWEKLQSRVQKMRAEFNMQRTHAAMVEVKRRKNAEKEGAALQKKQELAEAVAFQKEAARSKEGRRALAKLTHVTVSVRGAIEGGCSAAFRVFGAVLIAGRSPVLKIFSATTMTSTTKMMMMMMRKLRSGMRRIKRGESRKKISRNKLKSISAGTYSYSGEFSIAAPPS
jgi:hypothetical protein